MRRNSIRNSLRANPTVIEPAASNVMNPVFEDTPNNQEQSSDNDDKNNDDDKLNVEVNDNDNEGSDNNALR